jgi:hypothetical protein
MNRKSRESSNIGYTLDTQTHWIHIGYTLDTHWIHIGYTLDTHWIHIGYTNMKKANKARKHSTA